MSKTTIAIIIIIVIAGLGYWFYQSTLRPENELEKSELIRVSTPRPDELVQSPLIIEGEARGFWFFEADFPVVLVDWDGLIIAEGIARAKGEWMTEDFVPFEAKIEFEKPTVKNNGTLILRKDNPSGLPEHDDALEIPILFK